MMLLLLAEMIVCAQPAMAQDVGEEIRRGSIENPTALSAMLRAATFGANVRRVLRGHTTFDSKALTLMSQRSNYGAEVLGRVETASRFSAEVIRRMEEMTIFTDVEMARIDDEFVPAAGSAEDSRPHLEERAVQSASEYALSEIGRLLEASEGGTYSAAIQNSTQVSPRLLYLIAGRSQPAVP